MPKRRLSSTGTARSGTIRGAMRSGASAVSRSSSQRAASRRNLAKARAARRGGRAVPIGKAGIKARHLGAIQHVYNTSQTPEGRAAAISKAVKVSTSKTRVRHNPVQVRATATANKIKTRQGRSTALSPQQSRMAATAAKIAQRKAARRSR